MFSYIRTALILAAGILFGFFIGQRYNAMLMSTAPTHTLAILLPAVHPSMNQIEKGFIETTTKLFPNTRIDAFNANGNKALMKSQAEEIVNGSYEMAFAVGTNASRMLKTTRDKKQHTMPLVCAAISQEIANELTSNDPLTTAIVDHQDREEQVELLFTLKKVKSPLLVYDPLSNPAFEQERQELAQAFARRGAHLSTIEIFQPQELQQKVTGALSNHDLVLTLTDHTLCSAMDALIKLCNRYGVTLYTSELDSNEKGAVLSYGVKEREYGTVGAQMAYQFIEKKIKPPVQRMDRYYFKINESALTSQQVSIDPLTLKLISKTIKNHD